MAAGVAGGALRLQLWCRGQVQGVGFRPLVHRLATARGLVGLIENVAGAVRLDLQGPREALAALLRELPQALPPAARLEPLQPSWLPPLDPAPAGLRIAAADPQPLGPGLFAPALAPDLAPCPACLAELRDPANRRHRYPFISCAACGPRYSIATAEPYARAHTTLATFPLCSACRAEFDNPNDRRFHAETIGCPACGPQLRLWRNPGLEESPALSPPAGQDSALQQAAALLAVGGVLALQGVGGFQLLVDATDAAAVARLRRRKRRPHKPFALLVAEADQLQPWAELNAAALRLLQDPAAPIVLLRRRPAAAGLEGVAPGSPWLGAMLPASPLHRLLAEALGRPLVATSGNLSGEPLCIDPEQAQRQLAGIADAFLVHNRPIARPLDDSLLQLIDGRPVLLRRARGYAPAALDLPRPLPQAPPLLAFGGDLKAAPALAAAGRIWLAPYGGDLAGAQQQRWLEQGLLALLERQRSPTGPPALLVADAHPGYASRALAERLADRLALPLRLMQHHQAHGAAVAAEHGLQGPLLVWAADGLGYGPGAGHQLWGCELLWLERAERPALQAQRLAGLRPWPLPGGERAQREPRRAALGLLLEADLLEHPGAAACRAAFTAEELPVLTAAVRAGLQAPRSSALGRLFDAAASLLDRLQCASYEGQGGLLLEGLARRLPPEGSRPDGPQLGAGDAAAAHATLLPLVPGDGLPLGWLDWQPLLLALLEGCRQGFAPERLAAWWHARLVEALVAVALQAARERGCRQVALSGGCFQNALLLEGCIRGLRAAGLAVYWPQQLPCNDGGLALGQLWAGLAELPITTASGNPAPCVWPPLG